jgi:hypothetical protein
MRTRVTRPAMAQQTPTLSDFLIWAQLLSLLTGWLRSGAGRFLDILIALFSL